MRQNENEFVTTNKKALSINHDKDHYGTFVEIGAGQEVARHFFQVGKASNTIAKTMSAYDMTFSDAIYGSDERYVSESRLCKMLDHEFELLTQRLGKTRGKESLFFVFANTMAIGSLTKKNRVSHGWLGVRFQIAPGGQANDVILHVKMKDINRLQQQEAIGILGVNILFSSFYLHWSEKEFAASLVEGLGVDRLEINILHLNGPDLVHLNEARLNLELVSQKISNGILFQPDGSISQPSEALYKVPLLTQKGNFRPVTKVHLHMIDKSFKQFSQEHSDSERKPQFLVIVSMMGSEQDVNDYLKRVEIINSLGYHALVSNLSMLYELKEYLCEATHGHVSMLLGASQLDSLFDEGKYKDSFVNILSAFGRLFDGSTKAYVFPFISEREKVTANTFSPSVQWVSLYKYFLENQMIKDVATNYEGITTPLRSKDIREMLETGSLSWENLVPFEAVDLIKKHQLFGYKS